MPSEAHDDSVYEEVDLSEMTYEADDDTYYYECPCGDMFEITKVRLLPLIVLALHVSDPALHALQDALVIGETIAHCPSCSLLIRVLVPEGFGAKMQGSTPGKAEVEALV